VVFEKDCVHMLKVSELNEYSSISGPLHICLQALLIM
jgi:hypothetical protein